MPSTSTKATRPPPPKSRPEPSAPPRRALQLKDFSTLQIALGVSVAVHAALLGVRFASPEAFNRVFRETPLEVILVNAKSDEKPDKAQALAQTSLAGGGDLDKGRATSPLPPSAFSVMGTASEDAQRKVEAMQAQQSLLLTTIKRQLAAMPPPDPSAEGSENQAQEEMRRHLSEQVAEIERRISNENARPRKRTVSPSTRESAYAYYIDAMRRRIEARGTENFPELDGKKLYGNVGILITVNADGALLGVEVAQGSGNATLDRRAMAIVRSLANFGRFSAPMRQLSEQIQIPWRFKFNRDETLETQVSVGR